LIDDNFILMLNAGAPALELVTQEETNQAKHQECIEKGEEILNDNAGVTIIEKPLGGESIDHPLMIKNYKEKMADVI